MVVKGRPLRIFAMIMFFNSFDFAVFLALVLVLYHTVPKKWQNLLLLVASYTFYGWWDWRFLGLILLVSAGDYYSAVSIHATNDEKKRRRHLMTTVIMDLGALFFFKYFNFFVDSFNSVLTFANMQPLTPIFRVTLPVGISFFTFQSMSHVIDVYRKEAPPASTLWNYLLYISFFPQLVAGPIMRTQDLLPQVQGERHTTSEDLSVGMVTLLWGLFKKVAVADNLALYVDTAYHNPASYNGITLWIATIFFAFQIYCDFSGYSDMAVGMARMMGFRLTWNFRTPYFSTSMREFWQRWHITLSSWFRDYVYIPLGGSKVPPAKTAANIMIVFLLSGLWHGAAWTFVIWGGLHGVYLVLERWLFGKVRSVPLFTLQGLFRAGTVFLLTTFAWIFFRASSLSNAVDVITHLFSAGGHMLTKGGARGLIPLTAMLGMELWLGRQAIGERLEKLGIWPRIAVAELAVVIALLFGVEHGVQFIYFQF